LSAAAPIAQISLKPLGSVGKSDASVGINVHFEFPQTGEIVDLPLPDRGPLNTGRARAGEYLKRLVAISGNIRGSLQSAEAALGIVLNGGRELLNLLAQDDPLRKLRLENAFRQAWPSYGDADWGNRDADLPFVQVVGQREAFPFEMLPAFNFGGLEPLRTDLDLARAAARFLGFTAVVQRDLSQSVQTGGVLLNDPWLPIQFGRHRGVGRDEESFLRRLDPYVEIDGPWPDSDRDDAKEMLLEALYYPARQRLDRAAPRSPSVQVQHFACHCDTTATFDRDYEIVLTTSSGKKRPITLGEIKDGYDVRLAKDRKPNEERAVIIMNACASSHIDPTTASSFPQWFIANGHRACIGTETDVPNGVASEFGFRLYTELLDKQPLGVSIVRARRSLLLDHKNPLGALYVMYGDAELAVQVRRPILGAEPLAAGQ
jgi:hypothetical protein